MIQLVGLGLIFLILLAGLGAFALFCILETLEGIHAEIVGVIDCQELEETPDMIALLGAAYAPGRLRPQGEAIVEGALASRQMTSHELVDALLGGKPPSPPVPGDVLEI